MLQRSKRFKQTDIKRVNSLDSELDLSSDDSSSTTNSYDQDFISNSSDEDPLLGCPLSETQAEIYFSLGVAQLIDNNATYIWHNNEWKKSGEFLIGQTIESESS